MDLLKASDYIEHCLKIRDKDGNLIPFRLNRPQRRLYETIRQQWAAGRPVRIIILKARQMGFSTLSEAIIFWMAATATQTEALIVAHQDEATGNLFRMSKRFLEELPAPVRPMTKASNAQEIAFDAPSGSAGDRKGLGSRIRCATAGGRGIGRSYTLRALHLSEYAYWPGDKRSTLAGLMQAVPDKPGTLVIIESTANGYDDFKTLWDRAVAKQRDGDPDGFVPVFFPWFEMPEYRRPVPEGFQATPEEREMADTFGLDDEQLAWRRWCIDTNCSGDLNLFRQEYPATPEEAFIATGTCVFNKDLLVLRRAQVADIAADRGGFRVQYAGDGTMLDGEWVPDDRGPIRIYKHPEDGVPYVIGGDTAGEGSDYFIGQVLDNRTGEQVAVLRHQYGEREYAEQMVCLARYYNEALIGVEVNYSTYPQLKMEELGYHNFFVRQRVDTFTGETTKAFGFQTSPKTRPLIIDGLKDVANHSIELINDFDTLGEMLTFVYNERRRPEAEEGAHDDCVMALAIAWYIRPQQRMALPAAEPAVRRTWTEDMWADYRAADPDERARIIDRWGAPPYG